VNHLGHFLFTILLLKANIIKSGGRIVNVSSNGHRMGDIRFDDPGFEVCQRSLFVFISYLADDDVEWQKLQPVGCIRPSEDRKYALFSLTCCSIEE
jgi:NAD(P)-dependent dehydrogenase (short-subunit alcohol dehydrogenase family)